MPAPPEVGILQIYHADTLVEDELHQPRHDPARGVHAGELVVGTGHRDEDEEHEARVVGEGDGTERGVEVDFRIADIMTWEWTPDAYEGAPTPVTAFFATAPKVAAMAMLTPSEFVNDSAVVLFVYE